MYTCITCHHSSNKTCIVIIACLCLFQETLVIRDRSCGPTVSRDLADVLLASNSLARLELYRTTLDHDFYQLWHTKVSTMAVNILMITIHLYQTNF